MLVCCGLLYDADCVVLDGRVTGELERIWKEVVVAL